MLNISDSRHDRLAVRLSVVISRLMAGESLSIQALADEFGVSERTLQRDFHQRLGHLDIIQDNGFYRLNCDLHRDLSPVALSFIRNTGISRIIPAEDRELMNLLAGNSDPSPCFIWHSPLKSHVALPEFFTLLVRAISEQVHISVLIEGQRHDGLAPYRLIHFGDEWYLVVSQRGEIRVFALSTVGAITLSRIHFTRREDISYLTAGEGFIAALPHFSLISDVINTFRG